VGGVSKNKKIRERVKMEAPGNGLLVSSTLKTRTGVLKFHDLKRVFKKLRFHDELLWTVYLTANKAEFLNFCFSIFPSPRNSKLTREDLGFQ